MAELGDFSLVGAVSESQKLEENQSSNQVVSQASEEGLASETSNQESNASDTCLHQMQPQAQGILTDSAEQPEPNSPMKRNESVPVKMEDMDNPQTVCSLWTCGSSRRNSTSGDSCSSTDSSDESAIVHDQPHHCEVRERNDDENKHGEAVTFVPRTKGETLYQDLPPVEYCDVEFPDNGRLLPVAMVSHYTEKLLILCSLPNTPPIDEGTVLWTKAQRSIAKVFETFGPVRKPFYSIRINSMDDLQPLGITFGDEVYVIPAHPTLTKYVFPQELMKWKGSDASWKGDNEVPQQFQDYSDDENETKASKKRTNIRRKAKNESTFQELRRPTGIGFNEPPRLQPYASEGNHILQHTRPEVSPYPYHPGGVSVGYNPYSGVYPLQQMGPIEMLPPGHSREIFYGPIPQIEMLPPGHSREIFYGHPAPPSVTPQFYQYPPANIP